MTATNSISFKAYRAVFHIVEKVLAAAVCIGIVVFAFQGLRSFLFRDWGSPETFYAFISFVLLLLLGVELIRLLMFHSFTTVLELIILIISRKMLKPDISSADILTLIISIAVVVAIYYVYSRHPLKELEDLSS